MSQHVKYVFIHGYLAKFDFAINLLSIFSQTTNKLHYSVNIENNTIMNTELTEKIAEEYNKHTSDIIVLSRKIHVLKDRLDYMFYHKNTYKKYVKNEFVTIYTIEYGATGVYKIKHKTKNQGDLKYITFLHNKRLIYLTTDDENAVDCQLIINLIDLTNIEFINRYIKRDKKIVVTSTHVPFFDKTVLNEDLDVFIMEAKHKVDITTLIGYNKKNINIVYADIANKIKYPNVAIKSIATKPLHDALKDT